VVTGASSGIGAAIARELAARGHGVTLVARREERLRALASELSETHFVRAEPLACDLADAEARATLAERVEALGLRVDTLVNNAGLGSYGAFVAADRDRETRQVQVMCEAVVDLCGAFAPAMATRGGGGVLIVSSSLALMPMARYATYGATRSFCLSFGESLHAELRGAGVAVSVLCPGPVETEFFATNGPQPVQSLVPAPMWTSPGAVATAAVDGLSHNRRVIIPGALMRTAMAAARLVPQSLRLRALDRFVRTPGES
jgi:short-subunit dehydrogenase